MPPALARLTFITSGLAALAWGLCFVALYASSGYSYLLFHTLVELFSILIAFLVFALVWNTRRMLDNQYLLFLGVSFLFSGALVLAHTLAYQGMEVFPGYNADLSTQMWIAFRYVFSISFLLAPFFINRRVPIAMVVAAYGAVTAVLVVSIFSGTFPTCYRDGVGMTPFKIFSEYAVSLLLLAALGLLIRKRDAFDRGIFFLLCGSVAASVLSAISYTQYVAVIGTANMAGHLFELIANYLIYRAVVVAGLVEPTSILFRNLKQSEARIRDSEERYRSLVDLSPDAIVVRSEGVYRYVNPAGVKLFGAFSADELVNRKVMDLTPPDHREAVAAQAGRIREGTVMPLTESQVLRFDGRSVDIEATETGTLYEGRPAVQAIIRDITDRKRAEREIERLASFPRLNPNPVFEMDARGQVSFYNEATKKTMHDLGMPGAVDRLLPQDLKDLLAAQEPDSAQALYREVRIAGRVFAEHIHLSGTMQVARIYALDITARKEAEEALRTAKDELELRVLERTRELNQAVDSLRQQIEARAHAENDLRTSNDKLRNTLSEQKKAEENLSRLNRLYSLLSRVNEAIVRIHDADALYREVCRIAVQTGSFKMAWIGIIDADTRRVVPVASFGDDAGYLQGIVITASDAPEGKGPTGRSVVTGAHVVCSDIEHDPIMQPWRHKALKHGFRSSAAFPLSSGSGVIGAFTVYSEQPQFFTEEESSLLASLAEDISFAIDSIVNEKKRKEAEERAEVSNKLLWLFTRKLDRKEYLDAALDVISSWVGCHHAGIRVIDEQAHIPFEACQGYNEKFLTTEKVLSLHEDDCICTRIAKGAPKPSDLSCMTRGGSFYSRDAQEFYANVKPGERADYRGHCISAGFHSLAIIPIRYRDEHIGAIHLADERPGIFRFEMVEFLEYLSFIVGEAVLRFGIEEELRKNYDALRESETRYRSLVEDVRDIIFTVKTDGTIASFSTAFGTSTGWDRDEWIGKQFTELIHPDDVSSARDIFHRILGDHSLPLFELRARTRSGDYRNFEFTITSGRTAQGHILGIARDVTERKRTEQKLRLFMDLINQSMDAVYVADPETSAILEFNDAACVSTGYERHELLTMKVTDLAEHQVDIDHWLAHVAVLREKGSLLQEDRVKRKDGSIFPVEVSVKYLVRDRQEYMVAVIRDVTERKQAEEDRVRLAAALEAAADAVVITDPSSGVIQYVNHAFEEITGYTSEETLGHTLHFLESGRHDDAYYQGLREALATDGVWSGRLVNIRKNGSLYFEDCTVSPVKNRSGAIINYVYLKRDVTDKVRLESIAESINTMNNIGFVFSGVRHEIGNPVNAINMILGILRNKLDTLPTDAVREYLGRMAEQVGRVEYILRSLKSFNLYETQQPQNVEIAAFLENFLPLVTDDLVKKGIVIEMAVDAGSLRVYADPRALQQVLLNIITNASDAVSGRRDPKIIMSVVPSGGMIVIRIQDNGCGIPEAKLQSIFKPFFTTKPKGTGLGLVIVRKMLANMNGTIDIESREDEGTMVTIALPEGRDDKN
jgi:PAS domain S-box-containing protein